MPKRSSPALTAWTWAGASGSCACASGARPQRDAASLSATPARVIAGAGTGKTAVIAERFRRLLAAGADPSSILVMTFTDRAAREMRDRIEQLIGADAPA